MYNSNTVENAYFTSSDQTLIDVVLLGEGDNPKTVETIIVEIESTKYQQLLELYTVDQLEANREARLAEETEAMKIYYETLIESGEIAPRRTEAVFDYGNLVRFICQYDDLPENLTEFNGYNPERGDGQNTMTKSEHLFELKLAAFDLPQIENSTDETIKENLRTATTPIEVMNIVNSVINS
jgi:hypothetical protein